MLLRLLILVAVFLVALANWAIAEDIDCGFFNEIEITDPAGDATPGAPPYVDVLGVRVRQIGEDIQFDWIANGNPENDNGDFFFLFFDTDLDPATGVDRGIIGAEIKIGILGPPHSPYIHRFDSEGNWTGGEPGPRVIYRSDGFTFQIPLSVVGVDQMDLYFEASGSTPWRDEGPVARIEFQPTQPATRLVVESVNLVPIDSPPLINIPSRQQGVPLIPYLDRGGVKTPVPTSEVSYMTSHPREEWGSVPDDIISIDSQGRAHYVSEGFVMASAYLESCSLLSDEFILATGDVFMHPILKQVVAVFPSSWAPPGSPYTFGYMMDTYPNYMQLVNHGYLVQTELYRGFGPFDGATQIFALVVEEGLCGSNGNPLQTSPGCYMVFGDGSPHYGVVIHEMGHNFSLEASAMRDLLFADDGRIAWSGFVECVASLPIVYFEKEVIENGARYGIEPGSFEEQYFESNSAYYCPDSQGLLEGFEAGLSDGQVEGIFDTDNVESPVGVWCSFFQAFSCDYIEGPNLYRHHMTRRFLNVFSDEPIPGFREDKVDTYFGAAYSAAAGRDMRAKLEFWGFEIDDEFYDQIMPMIESRIELFSDRFESGDTSAWSSTVQ